MSLCGALRRSQSMALREDKWNIETLSNDSLMIKGPIFMHGCELTECNLTGCVLVSRSSPCSPWQYAGCSTNRSRCSQLTVGDKEAMQDGIQAHAPSRLAVRKKESRQVPTPAVFAGPNLRTTSANFGDCKSPTGSPSTVILNDSQWRSASSKSQTSNLANVLDCGGR